MSKAIIFSLVFLLLQNIFSQDIAKEQQYVQKFIKSVLVLEEMGHYSFSNKLAQRFKKEKAYLNTISILEKSDLLYRYLAIEKRGAEEMPVRKMSIRKNIETTDALYLIWLLSILKNRIGEPALAETLNEILQPHWKGSIVKEVEKQQKTMFDWYENLNKKQGLTWKKLFSAHPKTKAVSVVETKEGEFLLLGEIETEQDKKDIFLLKLDSQGNPLWNKTLGGLSNDLANSLIKTRDNGYLILATTWSFGAGKKDIWAIKINKDGVKEWEQTYGGKRWEESFHVLENEEGGFTIAASSNSFDSIHEETWVVKTDKDGIARWKSTIEGKNTNKPAMIQELQTKELVFVGDIQEYSQDWNIRVVKISSDGKKVWEKFYGGTKNDHAVAIHSIPNGGFIVAGYTGSFGNAWNNVWLIQLDKEGNKVWDKTIGEAGSTSERPTCLQLTMDGDFVLSGYFSTFGSETNYGWIIKVDSQGTWCWKKNLGELSPRWIIPTKDKGLLLVGEQIFKGVSYIFAIKTDSEGRF